LACQHARKTNLCCRYLAIQAHQRADLSEGQFAATAGTALVDDDCAKNAVAELNGD
jgi:hypothetical protein